MDVKHVSFGTRYSFVKEWMCLVCFRGVRRFFDDDNDVDDDVIDDDNGSDPYDEMIAEALFREEGGTRGAKMS